MELRCRLCSSRKHLISMFHGKYHLNRDYIRKLIAITTGIEIEQQDNLSKCVCINCCIFTFNFYKFRWTSIQNENKLKNSTGNENEVLVKANFKSITNIKLPPEQELFEFIGGWLSTKRKICYDERKTRGSQICTNAYVRYDKCIETHILSCKDVTTQTNANLFNNVSYSDTQIENIPFIASTLSDQDTNVQDSFQSNSKLYPNKKRRNVKEPLLKVKRPLLVDIPPQSNSDPTLSSVSPIFVKSTNVEICTICDRTIYRKGGLKKHMQTHMQCYVCKKKFGTLKQAQNHIKYQCHIRELTKKMPVVHLTKIEDNRQLSRKYPQLVRYLHSLKIPNVSNTK